MEKISIPHATGAFVDQSRFPYEILIAATALPEHSPAGPEADARHDMLKAIAAAVAQRQMQGYQVHWERQR
jgi:hypothetical protein